MRRTANWLLVLLLSGLTLVATSSCGGGDQKEETKKEGN